MSGNIGYTRDSKSYARGINRERVVIDKLARLGWAITPASEHDNVSNDIDAQRTLTGLPGGAVATLDISIKSLTRKTYLKSGSLLFELEVWDKVRGGWQTSWYHNGTAQAYVFDIEGVGLYYISKAKLEDYVTAHGWHRTVQNSESTIISQEQMGHRHLDSYSGLVSLRLLLKRGVAKVIEAYDTPSRPVKRERPRLRSI